MILKVRLQRYDGKKWRWWWRKRDFYRSNKSFLETRELRGKESIPVAFKSIFFPAERSYLSNYKLLDVVALILPRNSGLREISKRPFLKGPGAQRRPWFVACNRRYSLGHKSGRGSTNIAWIANIGLSDNMLRRNNKSLLPGKKLFILFVWVLRLE